MNSNTLPFKRTGKITLRSDCGNYLVIRYPTRYTALHGPQTDRTTIGQYPTSKDAQNACIAHAMDKKIPPTV